MEKMRLNEGVRSDHVRYRSGVSSISAIFSVQCNFHTNLKAKGGHLVVFCATRVSNTEGEVCCCDDSSTQSATVDEVERTRFWSSFSGRAFIMKSAKAWHGLRSVIVDKR